jgi:hypothetical protein
VWKWEVSDGECGLGIYLRIYYYTKEVLDRWLSKLVFGFKTDFHLVGKLGSKQVYSTGGRLTRDTKAHRSYSHRLKPSHLHIPYI